MLDCNLLIDRTIDRDIHQEVATTASTRAVAMASMVKSLDWKPTMRAFNSLASVVALDSHNVNVSFWNATWAAMTGARSVPARVDSSLSPAIATPSAAP